MEEEEKEIMYLTFVPDFHCNLQYCTAKYSTVSLQCCTL